MTTASDSSRKPVPRLEVVAPKAQLTFGNVWKYDPSPESTTHAPLQQRYELFIGGTWVAPKKKRYDATINPATEQPLAEVAHADASDVAHAVRAARLAYEKYWKRLPGKERAKYLYRIARILAEQARAFAVVESLNNGKPIRLSRDDDIPAAIAHFFYYAGWADKLDYAFPGCRAAPIGVAGQIIPWNFPLLMAAWKIAPALACGNTVVLKPCETTPLTALLLAKVVESAELPPGVVNVVTGDGTTGAALVAHPDVNKIAFTGSTDIGKTIQRAIAGTRKRLTLELGGKSPNIIFEDASLDAAVEGIIGSIFYNQGHVCCAGSRLLVQESVAPLVLRKLIDRLQSLRIGDPLDKNTDLGAIHSKPQLDKIESYIATGVEEGATLWQAPRALPPNGYWCAPAIFTDVASTHRIAREEIFGPVLSVLTFRTPEEAVEKANNTPFGLAASIWSDKGAKEFKITGALKAGVIWNNTTNQFDPAAPFGGYKESGFGREGGLHGLYPYVELTPHR